ncbi:hypothetical protein Sjap_002661 [Stephania japonica]|uniref:Uncharacterized protein n=1 Tax=Stephania japonica TaxID=461633 RepID=A0AAP0KM97_9MAGN
MDDDSLFMCCHHESTNGSEKNNYFATFLLGNGSSDLFGMSNGRFSLWKHQLKL